jgi:Kef-type K+ transport system membrane component KefB
MTGRPNMMTRVVCAIVVLLAPTAAAAATAEDSTPLVLGTLALVLVVAKIVGYLANLVRQPPVLGELLAGIVLGNLSLFGWDAFGPITSDPGIALLAELGVIILLFEVGLESTVAEMRAAGLSSLLVALLGVVTPFALGWGTGNLLLPQASPYVHLFLGATLTATSVGITARILKDLGRSGSREAKVILGAAVIDDVLGLVVLALVTDLINAANQGGELSPSAIVMIVGKALGFLVGALALGIPLAPWWFRLATRLRTTGVLLAASLAVCFLLAWVAALVGLAPIVGAFAAGLLLEDIHYRDLESREQRQLKLLLEPIAGLLVPVFFVLMGMRVDLRVFADSAILAVAAVLTLAAIVGKLACALGVVDRGLDRLSIGLGMVPRGEVGLIFAGVGLNLRLDGKPIVDASTYGAVLVMVLVTTLVTPFALRWSLGRPGTRASGAPPR